MVQLKAPSKSTWAARTCLGMGGGGVLPVLGGVCVCVSHDLLVPPPPTGAPPNPSARGVLTLCVSSSPRGEPCFCLVGRRDPPWWVLGGWRRLGGRGAIWVWGLHP